MRKCSACDKKKPDNQFNWKNKQSGKKQSKCKICAREYWNQHRRQNIDHYSKVDRERKKRYIYRNQEFIADYLKSHPCVDCGETDIVTLTFDHVRGKKKFNLCSVRDVGYSIETLKDEIGKCEIRCHNCHNKRTAKIQSWWILEYA